MPGPGCIKINWNSFSTVPLVPKDFLELFLCFLVIVIQFTFPHSIRWNRAEKFSGTTETVAALKFKEQYPVIAHAPNSDFWTGCREIKRCEESKRTLKNPFASRLAEFNTTQNFSGL